MERIKQALELARQERERFGAKTVTHSSMSKAKKSVADQDIEYTETQSLGLAVRELREKRVVIDQQNAITDAYRLLRTQILQRLNDKDWNALAITSPRTGDGKSLTAINLAISLAREVDYTVLLVDANLRSPSIHNYFDFNIEHGLSDYLCGDATLSDVLVHPEGIPRFVVLPAGHAISNSSEMLSSPKMNRLVGELKNRYPSRIILFNLPPLLESSDALAFMPNTDAALLVIEEGKTQEQELRQSFELMQGCNVIGTVLNKAYTRDRQYGNLEIEPGIISKFLNKISKKTLPKWNG